jgi:hypothetical protein
LSWWREDPANATTVDRGAVEVAFARPERVNTASVSGRGVRVVFSGPTSTLRRRRPRPAADVHAPPEARPALDAPPRAAVAAGLNERHNSTLVAAGTVVVV